MEDQIQDGVNISQWRIQDFPEGGAWTLQGGREHAKFSRKLHEIERIWTPRGGRASLTPPPRSANVSGFWVTRQLLQIGHDMDIHIDIFAWSTVNVKIHKWTTQFILYWQLKLQRGWPSKQWYICVGGFLLTTPNILGVPQVEYNPRDHYQPIREGIT